MSSPKFLSRILIAVVTFVLCGGPQLLQAQQATQPSTTQQQQDSTTPAPATSDQATPEPTEQDQNVGTTQQNATPDPSKAPLQPAETNTLPNAPSTAVQPSTPQQQQPAQAPAGAAAAQGVKTAGGAASRPAGTAIAPAKQHQSRSLFIKIGAVAAGAAALGVVYGLSRSSPSVPPGARTSNVPVTGR